MKRSFAPLLLPLVALLSVPLSHGAEPELLDDRFTLSLFAEHPTVRTPVGCALDEKGRLLVIESHTHFPTDNYDGPGTDRVLALSDTDGDGKADKTEVFWDGGKHLMSIAYDPGLQECYLASRSRIIRFKAGAKPGEELELARLDTTGEYPHNGLCGLWLETRLGRSRTVSEEIDQLIVRPTLHFGLGENLGHPYKLIAKDGTTLEGGGEGGNIYRMDGNGSFLKRIATGFWNPFGICEFDGQVFTVDNDPDSRPPNRLLHVIEGGDYGYQFRYGRPGTHPLQGWDGDFPGTLPMICGVGEGACSVMPYGDQLWVTSWGHHRIEAYKLKPDGATYAADLKTIIRGDESFRPVGICADETGSVFFTDWVDKSYPVHSKGRVWKLTAKKPQKLTSGSGIEYARVDPADRDPFWHTAYAQAARSDSLTASLISKKATTLDKVHAIAALRFRDAQPQPELIRTALEDPATDVQLAAVRWISDLKLTAHADDLRALAPRAVAHPRLFDAIGLTLQRLGDEGPKLDREAMLLAVATDLYAAPIDRITALRRISPDSKKLPIGTYRALIDDPVESVAAAARWHLTQRSNKDAKPLLEKLAEGGDPDAALVADDRPPIATNPTRDAASWLALLDIEGTRADPLAGRRVFFADHLGMCARCHTHGGYGNAVGPDLTGIGERVPLPKLIESIVDPNAEIAPMFQPVILEKNDGEFVVGLPFETTGRHGTGAETLLTVSGDTVEVPLSDIAARSPWVASLMPPGLDARLSPDQMRDLIAFLKSSP